MAPLLLALFSFGVYLIVDFVRKRRSLPPGPLPFPLFGNFPQLVFGGRWERMFAKWKMEYGGIYTFWFGPQPTVMIADYEMGMEILVGNADACSTRGDNRHFNDLCRDGTFGLVLTSGDLWKEQRRFAMKVLRDFGMGTNVMQQKVLHEVRTVINRLNEHSKKAATEEVDLVRMTELGVGSVIHSVLFGYRFDENNRTEFDFLKKLTFDLVAAASNPFVAAAIMNSTVASLPIFNRRLGRFVDMFRQLNEFVDKTIAQHEERLEDGVEPTDFVDAFLQERRRLNGSPKPHNFHLKQLRSVCIDMWFAGQETSASTLSWIIAFLIAHPDVQQRVHEELDRELGQKEEITMEDRCRLPYLQAVILESQRCANVVVQNVLRQLTRDIRVGDRILPKGTFVCPQISAMLWDPVKFPNPEEFHVERFLDDKGNIQRAEEVVAFSMGRRICPGEGLAKMELFLFTANLLHNFELCKGNEAPSLQRDGGGIATSVRPFKCRIHSRRV